MSLLSLLLASTLTVTAGGDAFMVQGFPHGYTVDQQLRDWIASGDARLVNFETVINDGSSHPAAQSGGTWSSMDPSVFKDFLAFGFNGCGCANNHSLDFGYDSLFLTMKTMQAAKLPFAGIGEDLQAATKAAIIDTPNGKVAFISVTATFHPDAMAGWKTTRSPGRPGLNGLRCKETFLVTEEQLEAVKRIADETGINGNRELNVKTGFASPDAPGTFRMRDFAFKVADKPGRTSACNTNDLARLKAAIAEAKRAADVVVVMPHSHMMRYKNVEEPADFLMEFCHAAIDAGADAVIGGGTHQLKGVELRNGKPIFYSLGDFVFQNNVVPLVPPDFCEQYGVALDADAKTAFAARSKGGKVGLHAFRENFLSVVPRIVCEDGKVKRIELMPIELHWQFDWDLNGLPRRASAEATSVIYSALKRTSAEFATEFKLREDGIIEVVMPEPLMIGWAERDITPSMEGKKIPLAGQYYVREATNIHSRLKFTCCVMRQGDRQILMGSLDNVTGWDPFTAKVVARLREKIPQVREESVFIGCPHSHSAPYLRPAYTPAADKFAAEHPDFLSPNEYADFVLEKAADAFAEAWATARPGGLKRAESSARLGHCRIACYQDGSSEMYGDTKRADFVGLLEGESSRVDLLFTTDEGGRETGVFVNAACPSQVMEIDYQISSDFAGAMRERLQERFGADFHSIYQLGAAGCQSPRDLVDGRNKDGFTGWDAKTVDVLADRLVATVVDAKEKGAKANPSHIAHEVLELKLPIRRVDENDVRVSLKELAQLEAKWPGESAWEDYLAEVHQYEQSAARYPYDSKLHPYAMMNVHKAVLDRYELQDKAPFLDVTIHLVRLGDVVFITNPFELYLAYGEKIREQSSAKQTFLIGKCGSSGYLPTERSERALGYSGGVNVGKIGHVGGEILCEEILKAINR